MVSKVRKCHETINYPLTSKKKLQKKHLHLPTNHSSYSSSTQGLSNILLPLSCWSPRHLPQQRQAPLLRQGLAGHQRVDRWAVGAQLPRRQRREELQGAGPEAPQGDQNGVVDDEIPGKKMVNIGLTMG